MARQTSVWVIGLCAGLLALLGLFYLTGFKITEEALLYQQSALYRNQVPAMLQSQKLSDNTAVSDAVDWSALDRGNYRIPDDQQLDSLTKTALEQMYYRYINSLQTLCRQVQRVGSFTNGGKEVCMDESFLPKTPCLIYSFGINYLFDFDEDAHDKFGCEVHSFDPSMKENDHLHSEDIWFHHLGLGDADYVNGNKWPIKTLASIRRDLGHSNRTLDILKVDIEGMEWDAFRQALESRSLEDVKQILVELHPTEDTRGQLRVLRGLYDSGFRIFMRERNMASHKNYKWKRKMNVTPMLSEICFLKRS